MTHTAVSREEEFVNVEMIRCVCVEAPLMDIRSKKIPFRFLFHFDFLWTKRSTVTWFDSCKDMSYTKGNIDAVGQKAG